MPATAIPASAPIPAGSAASIRPRMSAASASSSLAVGGSEPMWRSLWRTTPACREVWKSIRSAVADDQLGRAAADVDHQCRPGGGVLGGGAEVGQPRLFGAVEDAGREREALTQLGDEGRAVAGVADGAGGDRVDGPDAELPDRRHVLADRRAGVLDRLGREAAREVDAPAQPGDRAAPLDRADPAPLHVGHEQPRRVGPDVDYRDSLRALRHRRRGGYSPPISIRFSRKLFFFDLRGLPLARSRSSNSRS